MCCTNYSGIGAVRMAGMIMDRTVVSIGASRLNAPGQNLTGCRSGGIGASEVAMVIF